MTLIEFLLARIEEDEAAARAATQGNPHGPWCATVSEDDEPAISVYGYPSDPIILRGSDFADTEHVARHHPARVLAECEAKRRIVEDVTLHLDESGGWGNLCERQLMHLALPYADHPDYREEWRP